MRIEEIEEYQRRAKDGDPVAKEILTEFEKGINVEKDIKDVAVTTVKDPEIYKELSGYNDAVDTVNNILKGDYTEAAILAAGIILKPLKVGKHFDEILDAIEKNGGKAIVKDGKIYGKNKKGELVEVEEHEVGEYKKLKDNDIVGDNLDNHHVPQKDLAKKNGTENYPTDTSSNTAPAIRIDKDLHREITRRQTRNKVARSKMTPRELLADDARMLRDIGEPNKQIQEIIKLNKKKYGYTK